MIQGKKDENFEESNNMTPQIMPQMLYKEMPCKRHDNSLQLAHMKKKTNNKKERLKCENVFV